MNVFTDGILPWSAATVIYFRGGYSFQKDSTTVLKLVLAGVVTRTLPVVDYPALLWLLIPCEVYVAIREMRKWDHQEMVSFTFTCLTISHMLDNYNAISTHPEAHVTFQSWWLAVPLFSLAQFTRNPKSLKNFMSMVRKGLGPTSFLVTVYTALMEMAFGNDVTPKLVSASVMVAILLAVVVFRPDNKEVADLIFGHNQKFMGLRTAWHGNLNVFAVLGSLINYFITS